MNRFYKFIAYVLQFAMFFSTLAGVNFSVQAGEIIPADNATFKYTAPNGVPVVNIAKPNSRGLSHNRYSQFNVNANGAVLNNATKVLQSQLAGAIRGNPNLNPNITPGARSATIILNEVTSVNRSALNGFLEVNGQRADVIVANPNGITANGLGFINTNRAVLTTGVPNINAAGALTGFNVRRGDLLLQGKGVDGTSPNFLDLVVRSMELQGQLNANDLHITTGSNSWGYLTRTATPVTGLGVAPAFAVDTALLGGMYANRIKLVATEAGVGVRMLGDAAASVDDITVNANGIIELKSKISATRNLAVNYTGNQANGNILVNGASLTAATDIALNSTKGVEFAQSTIKANQNLAINAATLTDAGALTHTRAAGNNISITSSGQTSIDGSKWLAGNDLTASTGNFLIGNSGAELFSGTDAAKVGKSLSITSTTGDINLAAGLLTSANNLTLTADNAGVRAIAGASQGIKVSNNMALNANTLFTNTGQFLAGGNLTLRNSAAAGVLALTNSGRLQAGATLDLGGFGATDSLTVNNQTGGVLLGDVLNLRAQSMSNAGSIQGTGGSNVDVTNSLTNSGTWVASNRAGSHGTFNLGSLNNSGTLQSSSNLMLNQSALTGLVNTGNVLAGGDLTIRSTNNTGNMVLTNSGRVQAAALLDLAGFGGGTKLSLNNQTGGVLIGDTLIMKSDSLTNAATIQGTRGSTITVANRLNNSGTLIASDTAGSHGTLNLGDLSNSGTLQSKGNLSINNSALTGISNTGSLLASGDLVVRSNNSLGNMAFTNSGRVQAGALLDIAGFGGGTMLALNNQANGVLVGNNLSIFSDSLTNAAQIQGTAGSNITVANTLTNSGLLMTSASGVTDGFITAQNLNNSGTLQSLRHMTINAAGGMNNSGELHASNNLTLKTDGVFANSAAGVTQAGAALSIAGSAGTHSASLSNTGTSKLIADTLDLKAGGLSNAATVQAASNTAIDLNGALSNTGTMMFSTAPTGSVSTIAANSIDNSGLMQDEKGTNYVMKTAGGSFTNQATGKVLSNATLNLRYGAATGANLVLLNSGKVEAATLDFGGFGTDNRLDITNSAGALLRATNQLNVNANQMDNSGTVQSAGSSTMNLANFSNIGANSLLIASGAGGAGSMNVSGLLANPGAIHGNGDLSITATSLTNTNTAAYSSLGNLNITTTNDFSNDGALYGGTDLSITASNNLFTNAGTGTMDSGGTMNIGAASFHNFNNLNAAGDITINTSTEFKNMVTVTGGSVSSNTKYLAMTRSDLLLHNMITGGRQTFVYGAAARFSTNAGSYANPNAVAYAVPAYTATTQAAAGGSGAWGIMWQQEYTSTGPNPNCGVFTSCTFNYINNMYVRGQKKVVEKNKLTGTADKAQILSAATLSVNIGAGSGMNYGSVMSANTVNIQGTGSFTNDALNHTIDTSHYTYALRTKYNDLDTTKTIEFTTSRPDSPALYANRAATEAEAMSRAYTPSSASPQAQQSLSTIGAGVFANTLTVNVGGSVVNAGAAIATTATATSQTGAGASTFSAKAGSLKLGVAIGAAGFAAGAKAVAQSNALTLQGLNITLPTNPNGLFVLTKNSNAAFLVEGNPRFGLDAGYLGSNYLRDKLKGKMNTDNNLRRLGDASYENQLIKDQIIKQTGRNVLKKFGQNQKKQTQALFDNAVTASEDLQLSYGVALSKEQINSLKTDIVWMVTKKVNGQDVLVPQVYLSKATLDLSDPTGATLAAGNMDIKAKDFKNVGGTIAGDETLAIETEGDIENISGSISGGDLALTSRKGGVLNSTRVVDVGNTTGESQVGKQAGITATGNLGIKAEKDISSEGAVMTAGGDASLDAGQDVVFESIEYKRNTASYTGSGSSTTNSTTTGLINSGSRLVVGGTLNVDAGRDLTLKGSSADVVGGASITAGRDVNVLAATNSTSDKTVSHSDNGTVDSTDVNEGSTTMAAASALNIGGDLALDAGRDLTVVGSDVAIAGGANLKVERDINLLSAEETTSRDVTSDKEIDLWIETGTDESRDYKKTVTNRMATLSVGKTLIAEAGRDILLKGADVSVEGNAKIEAGRDFAIVAVENHEITENSSETDMGFTGSILGGMNEGAGKERDAITNQSSSLNIGGHLLATAERDIVVHGSEINTGGDGFIEAGRDQVITAAVDRVVTSDWVKEDQGAELYSGDDDEEAPAAVTSENPAEEAEVEEEDGTSGSVAVSAGIQRTWKTTKNTRNQTFAKTSEINIGGNLTRKAGRMLFDEGTQINTGGGYREEAEIIRNVAAEDTDETTTEITTTVARAGVYAEAEYEQNLTSTFDKLEDRVDNVKKAGSKVGDGDTSTGTRVAGGAAIAADVAGAVSDIAGLNASGSAEAGLELRLNTKTTTETDFTSTAVVSKYNVGGDFVSKSKEAFFEGTEIASGGDLDIDTGTLTVTAAEDVSSSTFSSSEHDAYVRVGLKAEATASVADKELSASGGAQLEIGYQQTDESSTDTSTTAVVASFKSGNKMNIKTKNDATFEGTELISANGIGVDAGGSVRFDAAKDTTTSSTDNSSTGASLTLSFGAGGGTGGGGAGFGGSVAANHSEDSSEGETSTERGGFINAGAGGLTITSGKDVIMVGTEAMGDGGLDIDAAGDVKMLAAKETSNSSEDSMSMSGEIGFGGGETGVSIEGSVGSGSSSSTTETGGYLSFGKMNVSAGNDVTMVGTELDSGGDIAIDAGGDVELLAAKSDESSQSLEISGGIGGGLEFGLDGDISRSHTETGVKISALDKLKITSGGETKMVGTDLDNVGGQDIQAAGGLVKEETHNSKFALSLDLKKKKKPTKKTGASAPNNNRTTARGDRSTRDRSSAVDRTRDSSPASDRIRASSPTADTGTKTDSPTADTGTKTDSPTADTGTKTDSPTSDTGTKDDSPAETADPAKNTGLPASSSPEEEEEEAEPDEFSGGFVFESDDIKVGASVEGTRAARSNNANRNRSNGTGQSRGTDNNSSASDRGGDNTSPTSDTGTRTDSPAPDAGTKDDSPADAADPAKNTGPPASSPEEEEETEPDELSGGFVFESDDFKVGASAGGTRPSRSNNPNKNKSNGTGHGRGTDNNSPATDTGKNTDSPSVTRAPRTSAQSTEPNSRAANGTDNKPADRTPGSTDGKVADSTPASADNKPANEDGGAAKEPNPMSDASAEEEAADEDQLNFGFSIETDDVKLGASGGVSRPVNSPSRGKGTDSNKNATGTNNKSADRTPSGTDNKPADRTPAGTDNKPADNASAGTDSTPADAVKPADDGAAKKPSRGLGLSGSVDELEIDGVSADSLMTDVMTEVVGSVDGVMTDVMGELVDDPELAGVMTGLVKEHVTDPGIEGAKGFVSQRAQGAKTAVSERMKSFFKGKQPGAGPKAKPSVAIKKSMTALKSMMNKGVAPEVALKELGVSPEKFTEWTKKYSFN